MPIIVFRSISCGAANSECFPLFEQALCLIRPSSVSLCVHLQLLQLLRRLANPADALLFTHLSRGSPHLSAHLSKAMSLVARHHCRCQKKRSDSWSHTRSSTGRSFVLSYVYAPRLLSLRHHGSSFMHAPQILPSLVFPCFSNLYSCRISVVLFVLFVLF